MQTCLFLLLASLLPAADKLPGPPVSVLITVEGKTAADAITANELKVAQNGDARPITSLTPLSGAPAQVLMLIDDSAGGSFDAQISSVKSFVQALPANIAIAVGYMRNGTSQMVVPFTSDHAQAASQIRLAAGIGGADVSPYDSLAEAIKKWPKQPDVQRREVIMIGSGLEGLGGGPPPNNVYVNAGIAAAQKEGIAVYAIYNPASGHEGHAFWLAASGQNFLSQLTDETGGELYQLGFGAPVSFEPYLTDILNRQKQQYLLSFEAKAENRSGLQPVKISIERKGLSIAAPTKVYVKANL